MHNKFIVLLFKALKLQHFKETISFERIFEFKLQR